jgi:WD40 repeat protein
MDQITPAPTVAAAASSFAKVFVSYSRKDLPFAQMLVGALVERGFDAFLDKTDIAPGEPWKDRLAGLIAASDTVVFVVSPDSVASSVCAWELEESGRLSKRLIPIVARRIADADAPPLLGRLNWVFCADGDDRDAALAALDTALHTDLDWVREHTRLGELARRWNEKGRSGSATLRGADLDAAERWLDRRPADANAPTDLHQDFIRASRRAQSRRRNILTGSLAAGLFAALGLAGLAYWQRGIAVEQRDKALLRQSQFLADVASRRITGGDSVNAMALGVEALPDSAAGVDRPYSIAAEAALFNAERHRQEEFVFAPPGWKPPPGGGAVFSPDGHLAAMPWENTAHVVDTATGETVAVLSGHAKFVGSIAFRPDGGRVATTSGDRTGRIWDISTASLVKEFTSDGESLYRVSFSPDGRRVAAIVNDKTVCVRDAETGDKIAALKGHTDTVSSFSFSPDSRRIVTSSYDKTARVWDVETGRELVKNSSHQQEDMDVWSAVFSPDGHRVLSVATNAHVWDSETGAPIATLAHGTAGSILHSGRFSPDGKKIVTTSSDHTARIWNVDSAKTIAILNHDQDVNTAMFSADGERVVTASNDNTARIWDAVTGKLIATLAGHSGEVQNAYFSRDGRLVLTNAKDGTARIWATRPIRAVVLSVEGYSFASAAFSPDSRRVATGSSDGTARIWDVETGEQIKLLDEHAEAVSGVTFSADGQFLLTWSADKTARIWSSETGEQIAVLVHDGTVRSARFSPDGRRVVTKVGNGARIWDRETKKIVATLPPYSKVTYSAPVFSPDGKRVLTSGDYQADVWDGENGNHIATLAGHTLWVMSATYSPDGQRIATASADRTARIWDSETGKQLVLLRESDNVESAVFSADRRRVATSSMDRNARIWNAETGEILETLRGHISQVQIARFSPDGRHVVTMSYDNTVRLWDSATGTEIAVLDGIRAEENILKNIYPSFSPDGRLVVATGGNDEVRLWRLFPTTQALLDTAKKSIPRCLTTDERKAAFLDSEPPAWCIETQKWPNQTQAWKDWLARRQAGQNPPMPKADTQ